MEFTKSRDYRNWLKVLGQKISQHIEVHPRRLQCSHYMVTKSCRFRAQYLAPTGFPASHFWNFTEVISLLAAAS